MKILLSPALSRAGNQVPNLSSIFLACFLPPLDRPTRTVDSARDPSFDFLIIFFRFTFTYLCPQVRLLQVCGPSCLARFEPSLRLHQGLCFAFEISQVLDVLLFRLRSISTSISWSSVFALSQTQVRRLLIWRSSSSLPPQPSLYVHIKPFVTCTGSLGSHLVLYV